MLLAVHREMQYLQGNDKQNAWSQSPPPAPAPAPRDACEVIILSSDEETPVHPCVRLSRKAMVKMVERGRRILSIVDKGLSPSLPYDWPIVEKEVLIRRLSLLTFTGNRELDTIIRDVLLGRNSLKSFHRSIILLTMLFWSDGTMRKRWLPSSLTGGQHVSAASTRKHWRQFYQLFMHIFDIEREEEFDACRLTRRIAATAATCRHREIYLSYTPMES